MLIRAALASCALLPLLNLEGFAQAPDLSTASHYQFLEPHPAGYVLAAPPAAVAVPKVATTASDWVKAWPDNGSTNYVEFGRRLVLQLKLPAELGAVLQGRSVQLSRTVGAATFILQAPDVWTSLHEAQELS